jgi:hypothetical protein
MNYSENYQFLLDEYGVRLHQLGLDDVALESEYALRAVKILQNERLPILGGDVFFKEGDNVRLAYANWYAAKLADESDLAYVERSCQVALKYIAEFPTKKDSTPVFLLTSVVVICSSAALPTPSQTPPSTHSQNPDIPSER